MDYKHGSHSDIQLLVKNGYNYKDSININKNLIRKKTRKYIKKYQSFKWCISIYKFNKYVNTYYYYNLEELKSVFKELFYIQNKDFTKTILVYDDNILNKYGSMRIRKTKGKNNLKFYYQINNI